MRRVTVSQLRANLDDFLDRVADTSEPIEVNWRGRVIRVSVDVTNSKLARLPRRKDFVRGDSADFVHMDWSRSLRPFDHGTRRDRAQHR